MEDAEKLVLAVKEVEYGLKKFEKFKMNVRPIMEVDMTKDLDAVNQMKGISLEDDTSSGAKRIKMVNDYIKKAKENSICETLRFINFVLDDKAVQVQKHSIAVIDL